MARHVHATYSRDPNGAEVVTVTLAGGQRAVIDRDCYEAMLSEGWSDHWFLVSAGDARHPEYAYVRVGRTRASGHAATVARIITGAGWGRVVKYRDRDPLNLRRANLYLVGGAAYRCDAEFPASRSRRVPLVDALTPDADPAWM